MLQNKVNLFGLILLTSLCGSFGVSVAVQSQTQRPSSTQPAATQPAGDSSASSQQRTESASARQQRLRAQRRARRRTRVAVQQPATQGVQQPDISAAQRARDQKLLDQQNAQSAQQARENDAVTRKLVRDQQKVQAEPRIQDAPGPGSQPLAGDPAIVPLQPSDPPRIQDAPGPAQTLPQAPPPASAQPTNPPAAPPQS